MILKLKIIYVFKDFNIEELKHEPPALKIRIFKGNSGELINEKEAKRIRKRKKKIEKQKVKMAKLSLDTGEIRVHSYSVGGWGEINIINVFL